MNSIQNLAKKNFIANKTKSFLIIITIILTTALLTCMGILCSTIKNANIRESESTLGRHHCTFTIENDKQFQALKNNIQIEKAGEHIYLGRCSNESLSINSVSLSYMDEDASSLNNIKLEKGRMPEKSNEIVMAKWIIEKLDKKPELGEKIHLEFFPNISKEDMWENKKPSKIEKDFIVCGILKENLEGKKYNNSEAFVSKAAVYESLDKKSISRQVDLRFKDIKSIEKNIYSAADGIDILHKDVHLNKFYLNELSPKIGNLIPFIIIGLILMITAIVVIYNIFYVSITQKIQSFGLLSALGATKKQMKKVIIIDGMYTCIVGIPLGVLLGYFLSYLLCNFVMTSFHMGNHFVLTVPISTILISASVSLFTVIIALIRPARAASKISPITAIRFSGYQIETKKKEREIKGEINIKKLSYLNLWRNKKRTLMTLFSLSMSGMIFIIISSVVLAMDINSNLKENIQNDFLVSSAHAIKDNGQINPLNENFIKKIKNIDGVTKLQKINHSYAWFDNSVVSNNNTQIASNKDCFSFYGFNDEMINKLKKNVVIGKISLDQLKNKNGVILVADSRGKYKFNVGEKVLLKKAKIYKDNNKENNSEKSLDKIYEEENDNKYKFNEFTVMAIVSKNIEGFDLVRGGSGKFIASQDTFNKTMEDNRPIQLRIDAEESKYENVRTSLKNLVGNDDEMTIKVYKEVREDLEKQFKSTKIISYGIVGIIAIIGVLNLINTRITSIITRRSEMGMIEAIGASGRNINEMIRIEGFYYSLISLLISIVFGLGIGYLCFRLIKKTASYMMYKFPLIPIIILIASFILVQMMITYSVKRMLNKDSIIDKIGITE